MAYGGADKAHRRPGLGGDRGTPGRQLVGGDAVEVQEHQPPGRPAQMVHPGNRLLAPVAALLQVYRGGGPANLGGQCPVVGLEAEPGSSGSTSSQLVVPSSVSRAWCSTCPWGESTSSSVPIIGAMPVRC